MEIAYRWLPRVLSVLAYLVEHPGRLINQDEMLEELWPETFVNPEVLRKHILEIRKALGDRQDKPEFIETVTKRGYRSVAPITEESAAGPTNCCTVKCNGRAATESGRDPLNDSRSRTGRFFW